MILWHKPTETAKGHGLVVVKKGKNIGILTSYEHRSQAPASRWCYLTELLKLEQENKKLQEKLEIAVKALEEIKNAYIDLTTQDEYGSYYIDEAKLFVDIVGKIIKELKEQD